MMWGLLAAHTILLLVIVILLLRTLAALSEIESRTRMTFWGVMDLIKGTWGATGSISQNKNEAD